MNDHDWELIEITALGDPGRSFIVNVRGSAYMLRRDFLRSYVLEEWGDWEWRE